MWAWLLFRERPSRAEQVGVLLATVGAVVVAQAANQGEHRLFGDLLVIGAVMLFGLYVAGARALKDALPPRTYAAAVYGAAAVTLGVTLLILPAAEGTTRAPPGASWLAMLGVAFIPTVMATRRCRRRRARSSKATVALVSPGETLGGIAIGDDHLQHERPQPLEWAGAAVVAARRLLDRGYRNPPRAAEARRSLRTSNRGASRSAREGPSAMMSVVARCSRGAPACKMRA